MVQGLVCPYALPQRPLILLHGIGFISGGYRGLEIRACLGHSTGSFSTECISQKGHVWVQLGHLFN